MKADRCTYGMVVDGVPNDEKRCKEVICGRSPLPDYCLEHYSLELRNSPAMGPEDIRMWAAAHADVDRLAAKFPQNSNQGRVAKWIRESLGEESASNGIERTLRFVEEAVELAQACGVDAGIVRRLVDYVFDRSVGDPPKEIAGCMVSLYGAASALGVDADEEFKKELIRIRQPEVIERCRQRQTEKREALGY